MEFVHLHTHSHYSFMRGTAGLESLCRRVRERGMNAVALTDTDGVYGLVFFLQTAREFGVRPVVGAEVSAAGERAVLLAKDREGYADLCRILTRKHGDPSFSLSRALEEQGTGLVVLSDSIGLLGRLKGRSDLYAELMGGRPYRPVLEFARREGLPMAATNGVYFLDPPDHAFHRMLRAIDRNTTLSRLSSEETAPASAWLKSPEDMAAVFPHLPEAVRTTLSVADQCRFGEEGFGGPVFPGFDGMGPRESEALLRTKSEEGVLRRYGSMTVAVRTRLDYELDLIGKKGFAGMFLLVEDIVRRAPRTCGRGSAAASLVSYVLGITHVDPIKHDLYFERFLNPGRKDPPDIDVDFPWDERDKILEYVFGKYGFRKAAMVANHVGFQPRAAVREMAKLAGMADGEIKRVTDRLAFLWAWSEQTIENVVQTHPMFRGLRLPPPWPDLFQKATRLMGMPRYLSVHCGGVVIVPDELVRYVPVQSAPKGVPIVQWEKDQVEDAGLIKIDLLGNRSLSVIRDALEAVRRHTGEVIPYDQFHPLDDPEAQNLVRTGNTLGVFYIESPAMRQLQKKTQKGDFEHLVIASSIIRPAANAAIREYVRRLRGEPYTPIHPILGRVLKETYGIMVYQEDVTKISVEMAGFTSEEGDGLRKTLSKKRNARQLSEYRERFARGALARGIPCPVIDEVWAMVLSFGGYSFCKSHSASYAMVSFQSAYLRAHHPAEFMAAVISNGGGYYSAFAYLSEARRMGLTVLPPDINRSERFTTGKNREIRVGLMHLKGFKTSALDEVLEKRASGGLFRDFEDFLRRISMDPSDVRILVKAGCFDSVAGGRSRADLLWQIEAHEVERSRTFRMSLSLFDAETVCIPRLGDYDLRTRLFHELEVLGFLLTVHPLDLIPDSFRIPDIVRADTMDRHIGRRVWMIGWWVTNKVVYTRKEEPMAFISFEDKTALFETVFFPDAFQRFCSQWSPVRPYLLKGKVEEEWGSVTLNVEGMEPIRLDGRESSAVSRGEKIRSSRDTLYPPDASVRSAV